MKFIKELPEWKAPGVKPPDTLRIEGWKANQKPPADYFNWLFSKSHEALSELQAKAALDSELTAHKNDVSNPHKTTATQVGLGNVDNIKQATKNEFDTHNSDGTRHITAAERTKWNGKAEGQHKHPWSDVTGVPDATVGQKGVVQLTHALNSNSTTTAATPASVKSAYDAGVAADKKASDHIANGNIHVTKVQKDDWDAKSKEIEAARKDIEGIVYNQVGDRIGKAEIEKMSYNDLLSYLSNTEIEATFRLDYEGKIAGSNVENSNTILWASSAFNETDLRLPSTFIAETGPESYKKIAKLDGDTHTYSSITGGGATPIPRTQVLLQYNIVAEFEKVLGPDFFTKQGAKTLAEKVALLKKINKSTMHHLYARASGPASNNLYVKRWLSDTAYENGATSNSSTIKDVTAWSFVTSVFDKNGCYNILAAADPSDGKTPSRVEIDYAYLDITIKLSLYDFVGSKIDLDKFKAELDVLTKKVDTHIAARNNPHNVTSHQVNVIPPYTKKVDDGPDTYPMGVSTSFVRSELGWFEYGGITTFKSYASTNGGILQIYAPYAPYIGGDKMKYRLGIYQKEWSDWKTVADVEEMNQIISGMVSLGTDQVITGKKVFDGSNAKVVMRATDGNRVFHEYYDKDNKRIAYIGSAQVGNGPFTINVDAINKNLDFQVQGTAKVTYKGRELATVDGNIASATKLQTARRINGTAFDGTKDITIDASVEQIPANADLNTYQTAGFYQCISDTNAVTVKNNPGKNSFSLLVEKTTTMGCVQTLTLYLPTNPKSFRRSSYNNTWGEWYLIPLNNNAFQEKLIAHKARQLETPRKINGVVFDGTGDINISANEPYTAVPSNSDLDTFCNSTGRYSGTGTTGLKNTPPGSNGTWFIIDTVMLGTSNGYQTYHDTNLNLTWFRERHGSVWDKWQQYARTTDNVASATKLQTPRKINNELFDGTKDIVVDPVSHSIPANSDLNTYTKVGFYYCPANATVQTLANSPTKGAFGLTVEWAAGCIQTIKDYEPNTQTVWQRKFYNTWGPWYKIATENDVKNMNTHIADKSNPHAVTAAQTGAFTKAEADNRTNALMASYGLGSTAASLTGKDLNLAYQTGFYMGSGMINAPTADWYYLIVMRHNNAYQKQILFKLHSNLEYERTLMNNVWSAWIEKETTSGSQAKAAAVQANLNTHTGNKANPHAVTAAQVGSYTKAETNTELAKKEDKNYDSGWLKCTLENSFQGKAYVRMIGDVVYHRGWIHRRDRDGAHVGMSAFHYPKEISDRMKTINNQEGAFFLPQGEAYTSGMDLGAFGLSGFIKLDTTNNTAMLYVWYAIKYCIGSLDRLTYIVPPTNY